MVSLTDLCSRYAILFFLMRELFRPGDMGRLRSFSETHHNFLKNQPATGLSPRKVRLFEKGKTEYYFPSPVAKPLNTTQSLTHPLAPPLGMMKKDVGGPMNLILLHFILFGPRLIEHQSKIWEARVGNK